MKQQDAIEEIMITETYPSYIVRDFKTYLAYLQSNKIKLTKTKGYLTKKDLLAIYPQLKASEGDVPKQSSQTGYPILHLFYCLSIELDFIKIKTTSTTKSAMIQNKNIEDYVSLTFTEQYMTLLETFWMRLNWSELQGDSWGKVPYLEFLLEALEDCPANKPISLQELGERLEDFGHFLYYFKYFGLWTFEVDEERLMKLERTSSTLAKSITLTAFFEEIHFALLETWEPYEDEQLKESFELLSKVFGLPIELDEALDQETAENKETLFSLLKPLFPSHALNTIIKKDKDGFVTGRFQFRVKLSLSCWRTLQLSGSHTLLDLHDLIQKAFDFDDDHLYAFYMDGKKFSQRAYHSPMGGPGRSVTEAKIGSLNLYEGQGFLYLFDFGDEWEFDIQVMKINEGEEIVQPKILKEHGKSPEQY